MGRLKAEHERQLDDISAQLMHFEASLRAKEKQIEKMIQQKEQVSSALLPKSNMSLIQISKALGTLMGLRFLPLLEKDTFKS